MPADPAIRLADAARRRHELTRSKAVLALRELDRTGQPVTYQAVAQHANVSRSWLYTQPDLRAEIERLRDTTRGAAPPTIPAAQRASDSSLLKRIQTATERNRQLSAENTRLRRQLAEALADQRATRPRPATTA
jgi:hypothetical protein